jgi:hypothetical protein
MRDEALLFDGSNFTPQIQEGKLKVFGIVCEFMAIKKRKKD